MVLKLILFIFTNFLEEKVGIGAHFVALHQIFGGKISMRAHSIALHQFFEGKFSIRSDPHNF